MNLKEYIRLSIQPGKQPDLKSIYEDLMNLGYNYGEIYSMINEQIIENIDKITENYINQTLDEAEDEDNYRDNPDHERDVDETE